VTLCAPIVIKKLTAEFIKKHEELNRMAEEINELEKE
jgi:hypothetical protein